VTRHTPGNCLRDLASSTISRAHLPRKLPVPRVMYRALIRMRANALRAHMRAFDRVGSMRQCARPIAPYAPMRRRRTRALLIRRDKCAISPTTHTRIGPHGDNAPMPKGKVDCGGDLMSCGKLRPGAGGIQRALSGRTHAAISTFERGPTARFRTPRRWGQNAFAERLSSACLECGQRPRSEDSV
jgi:hypothetical protein